MGDLLKGGNGTGDIIMKNLHNFSYDLESSEESEKPEESVKTTHIFSWHYNTQSGGCRIKLNKNGKINQSSSFATGKESRHPISTIFLNNDDTMLRVYQMMLRDRKLDFTE